MRFSAPLLLVLLPLTLFAHGGGQTVQQVGSGYTVSLDAVSPQLRSGAPERINFEVEHIGRTEVVSFTHVWLRIIDPDGALTFAGNVFAAPEGFVTGISYFFPRGGTYSITLRFFDHEQMLTEADLPVLVSGGVTSGGASYIRTTLLIIAPAAFLAMSYSFWRRRKENMLRRGV